MIYSDLFFFKGHELKPKSAYKPQKFTRAVTMAIPARTRKIIPNVPVTI